jgi:hypothetical protein
MIYLKELTHSSRGVDQKKPRFFGL